MSAASIPETPAPRVFESPGALLDSSGLPLGTTGWRRVEAADLSAFEAATGGPAAPYFALAITNLFLPELLEVRNCAGVNYGTGSVRFPAPITAGDSVRASAKLTAAEPVGDGVQTTVEITVEIEGSTEPACVVDSLSRWMP